MPCEGLKPCPPSVVPTSPPRSSRLCATNAAAQSTSAAYEPEITKPEPTQARKCAARSARFELRAAADGSSSRRIDL